MTNSTAVGAQLITASGGAQSWAVTFSRDRAVRRALSARAALRERMGVARFIRRPSSLEVIHFHELVHVVQWRTLGLREFLLTCVLGIIQHGCEESPLKAVASVTPANAQDRAQVARAFSS